VDEHQILTLERTLEDFFRPDGDPSGKKSYYHFDGAVDLVKANRVLDARQHAGES
jgi:hypothetical protein